MISEEEERTVAGDFTEALGWTVLTDTITELWADDESQVCPHAQHVSGREYRVPLMLAQRTTSGYDVTYTCAECVVERVAAIKAEKLRDTPSTS